MTTIQVQSKAVFEEIITNNPVYPAKIGECFVGCKWALVSFEPSVDPVFTVRVDTTTWSDIGIDEATVSGCFEIRFDEKLGHFFLCFREAYLELSEGERIVIYDPPRRYILISIILSVLNQDVITSLEKHIVETFGSNSQQVLSAFETFKQSNLL